MAGILGQNTKSENIPVSSTPKGILLNEDDMASDSDTLAATQQSIKAYIDLEVQRSWEETLSTVETFSMGDSDGAGNSTKMTINDSVQKITITAGDISLISAAIPANKILALDAFQNIADVVSKAHIVDADGTLSDITTKFNTLLSQIESLGLFNTS